MCTHFHRYALRANFFAVVKLTQALTTLSCRHLLKKSVRTDLCCSVIDGKLQFKHALAGKGGRDITKQFSIQPPTYFFVIYVSHEKVCRVGLYTKLFIIPILFLCVLQFRYLTSTTSRFHRFMYESDSFVTTCMHYIGWYLRKQMVSIWIRICYKWSNRFQAGKFRVEGMMLIFK